jgi:integrase
VLEPIWGQITETASRVRSRVERILDWAAVRGYRPKGDNPARWRANLAHLLVAPGKVNRGEERHHASLAYRQVPGFMADLRGRGGVSARALEFTVLTCARTEEVRGLTWSEINWTDGVWSVPASRMKNRLPHQVPLSDRALDILRGMQVLSGATTGFVFPGQKGGKTNNMTFVNELKAMNEARLVSGLEPYVDPMQGGRPITPHGFRSSFKDWASERSSFPDAVSEAALAHISADKVKAAYQRTKFEEMRRRQMNDWAEFCAMPAATGDTVVPMRKLISG